MTTWCAIIQETHIRASFTAPRRLRWRGPGWRGRPPSGQDSTTETVAGRALGRQETGRVGTDPRTDGANLKATRRWRTEAAFPYMRLTRSHDPRGP
jgi:hypothetical protein